MVRKIIHCDADCFFAAVEMRDNPALRHIPMAITGSTSKRGVVSTCNYEARRFGIHSAMPTWQALSLCPDLTLVSHNMDKYRDTSAAMMAIFQSFTSRLQKVSVDEAYLDVSDSERHAGSATLLAQEIKARVVEELGITISAGVAPNKFLAKVASEWRKPDGLFVIPPRQVAGFVRELPVEHIQGVGNKCAGRLHNSGIYTCGELQEVGLDTLVKQFGRFGQRLYDCARGRDERPVVTERVRKSLSVEHTFREDLVPSDRFTAEATQLYAKLCRRLEAVPPQYNVRKLQAKIKFNNFRQTTLETSASAPCMDTFQELIQQGLQRENRPIRLLGLGVQFAAPDAGNVSQLPLFQ